MSDTPADGTTCEDELTVAAFLDLLSTDLGAGGLLAELTADVTAFARTRNLSDVDVTQNIDGPVDI